MRLPNPEDLGGPHRQVRLFDCRHVMTLDHARHQVPVFATKESLWGGGLGTLAVLAFESSYTDQHVTDGYSRKWHPPHSQAPKKRNQPMDPGRFMSLRM